MNISGRFRIDFSKATISTSICFYRHIKWHLWKLVGWICGHKFTELKTSSCRHLRSHISPIGLISPVFPWAWKYIRSLLSESVDLNVDNLESPKLCGLPFSTSFSACQCDTTSTIGTVNIMDYASQPMSSLYSTLMRHQSHFWSLCWLYLFQHRIG